MVTIEPAPAQVSKIVYLGWKQPTLHAARDFLKGKYLQGNLWDLDRVLLVLPSSFASRRLGELLAEMAERNNWLLRPPEIVTVGALPEKLYQAQFPFANDLVQVLCWAKVLREAPIEKLTPLLVDVPSRDTTKVWIDLGRMLSNLHRELATDLMLFGDVADRLQHTAEEERWRVLAFLQREYLNQLHKYHLWDIQTARRVAIDRGESKTDRDIVVLGAVDMNRAQRRFLDAVASRVTVLVAAPEEWKAGFDRHGALEPEFWQNLEVSIDDDSLHVCRTIDDAADEVARQLANLPAGLSTQQITIGVPDSEVIPGLCERLARANVVARYGPGTPVNQSSPMRLLDWLTSYLEEGDFHAFASLIRHPMVAEMLRAQGELPDDYLPKVDAYYNATLLKSLSAPDWPQGIYYDVVVKLVNDINAWLKPLRTPPQPLAAWAEPLLKVVQGLFAHTIIDLDHPEQAKLWDACTNIRDAITHLDDVPADLQVEVSVAEAIGWVKAQTEKERIPPMINPAAIEMLGWLELALDDTEALMLTGLHDGTVPESVNADAFLPNELRKELGLMDNARRYARDCYVLQTILQTRKHVSIVTHQLNQKGDPLTPSRLLLAVPAKQLAGRVQLLLNSRDTSQSVPVQGRWRPLEGKTQIPIPHPRPTIAPTSIPVTDFKRYAECPYRYYLARIEKLGSVDDLSEELEANAFGDLLHNCLQDLKGSPVETSTDAKAIEDWLFANLDKHVVKNYGKFLTSTVAIQIEQAKQRLAAFASVQAQRMQEGWEIFATEYEFKPHQGYRVAWEGGEMWVHGRIDRIDFHPTSRTWAIWDYKSGDAGIQPKRASFSNQEGWKDFQLPLYRKLIQTIPEFLEGDEIVVGYILLPKSAAKCAFSMADFEEESLLQADGNIAKIASAIHQGIFWPPSIEGVPDWDPYARLCQTHLARPWRPEEDDPTPVSTTIDAKTQEDSSHPSSSQPPNPAALSQPVASTTEVAVVNQLDLSQHRIQGWTAGRLANRARPKTLVLPNAPGTKEFPSEWFDPLVIQASAGTGKTYRLSIRMMQLLFTEQPLDHVLATTFTRKAAGEILHRVLGRLADAILDSKKLEELRGNLKPLKVEVEHCQYQLARLCSQLHRFRVSTLDAFYAQLAKSFSLELQLPPGWTLADPFQEARLRDIAVARMLDSHDRVKLRTMISMLFKGESGRSVQSQVRQVVDAGYRLYRDTPKEAWVALPEVAPPSEAALQEVVTKLDAMSFKQKNLSNAKDKLLTQLLQEEWLEILGATIVKNRENDPPKFGSTPMSPELVRLLQDVADIAANSLLLQRRYQTQASYDLLEVYHQELELTKRDERTVTFDDVAWRLADWVSKKRSEQRTIEQAASQGDPTSDGDAIQAERAESADRALRSAVDFRLDARVDHLLLDEFQDTSPVQWNIVKPFAEAITRERIRRDRSFFCVGDGKQAIYGWRGGVAEILNSVVGSLHTEEAVLSQSYRSSSVVIDFVNEVFTHLDRHEDYGDGSEAIGAWQRAFPLHDTAKAKLPGYVQFHNGFAKGSFVDAEDEIADVTLMERAAEDIAQLAASAPHVSIGVLVRRNQDVAEMIHRLRILKVDASQEGGNPLTDSAPVELLLSLLHLADHPSDRIAAFQLSQSPLGPKLGCDPLESASALAEQVRSRIASFGYGESVAYYADLIAPFCNERDQQRLEQLIQMAYRYDGRPSDRIRDFVLFVEQERVALPTPSQVRVMTIHMSKGLEFDAVFLPELTLKMVGMQPTFVTRSPDPISKPDGVARYIAKDLRPFLPKSWQQAFESHAQSQLAEALCVFYVALTRARQALYLYGQPSKTPRERWDSVLQSILCSDQEQRSQENAVIYRSGDERWYAAADRVVEGKPEEALATPKPAPLSIQLHMATPETTTRLRPTTRPSSAAEGRKVALSRALEVTASTGAIIGTLIHRWFEEVAWLDDFTWDRESMRKLGVATLTPVEVAQISLEHQLDSMEKMLQMTCVRETLSKLRYQHWYNEGVKELEVSNERRLMEILDGSMLRGTIDRLVMGWRRGRVVRAEVLDYKTDARNPAMTPEAWRAERAEHHRPQLELYRRVLCKQFGIEPVDVQLTLVLLSDDCWLRLDAAHGQRRTRSKEEHRATDLFTPSLFPEFDS